MSWFLYIYYDICTRYTKFVYIYIYIYSKNFEKFLMMIVLGMFDYDDCDDCWTDWDNNACDCEPNFNQWGLLYFW